ncbi:MAG TPA: orotate phosphoribosyltransferase [Gemmatimonadota bacterium]|nr:orotate phosphoribosyltransferase [Gemmatimonadota bacterium]
MSAPPPVDWVERLRARGALLEGHFRLSSGLHSPRYVQCALLLQHPTDAAAAAAALVERLAERVDGVPDAIVSPAIGGIVLGQEVARAWGARAIWAERAGPEGELTFRRGFALAPGARVVAVEDVVTTAGSLRELVALCRAAEAEVAGAAALVDRSGGRVEWDLPWTSLIEIEVEQHRPESCPQCAAGIPAVKPGSRPG